MIGNCILSALVAKARNPRKVKIDFIRNRARRWHCTWLVDGKRFEFYAQGRSRLPYWRNLLYSGVVREVGKATTQQPTQISRSIA